jgi:diguanylate cyclase (GGDEF)-like protein/PAS domain S-box-containing protein
LRSLTDPQSLRRFVRTLPDGIYITNASGEILDANPACLRLFGVRSLRQLRAYAATELMVDPAQREREMAALRRSGQVREFELKLRTPRGAVRIVLDTCYACRDPATGEMLIHGILIDITERKRLEERLAFESLRDPLTGCFNRRHLGRLATEMERSRRPWGILVLDIDDFKGYNDRFGHKAGDEVLVQTSRFLIRQTRSEDAVFRIGGDEFLVVLPWADAEVTDAAAARLKAAAEHQAPVPFSLGWATRRRRETLETTAHRADAGLLSVKVMERHFVRRLKDRARRR